MVCKYSQNTRIKIFYLTHHAYYPSNFEKHMIRFFIYNCIMSPINPIFNLYAAVYFNMNEKNLDCFLEKYFFLQKTILLLQNNFKLYY